MTAAIYAFIVAMVLSTSSPASAECAWVLWMAADDPKSERVWQTVSGFPSNKISQSGVTIDTGWKLCKDALDVLIKQMRDQPELKNPYASCLPDTVDPRGRKGGGR
jgi:hypothetical protein